MAVTHLDDHTMPVDTTMFSMCTYPLLSPMMVHLSGDLLSTSLQQQYRANLNNRVTTIVRGKGNHYRRVQFNSINRISGVDAWAAAAAI